MKQDTQNINQTNKLSDTKQSKKSNASDLFTKTNYQYICAGVVVIGIGYLLMIGGKSNDPSVFNESDIYSFTKITLAPITILIGFGVVFYGILKNSIPTSI